MIYMTMRKGRHWIEPTPISDKILHTLQALIGGDPLVSTVLAQRGLTDPYAVRAFLDADAYTPAPPEDLPDLVIGAEHLQRAMAGADTILVWGDFDVDGQTATAVLVDGLRQLGARAEYYILNGVFDKALQHLRHGVRLAKNDYQTHAILEQRMKDVIKMQEKAKEL